MVVVIIIGGNAGGLSAASAIRKAHADWDLAVYEKGTYFSYGACGLPYYIKGEVADLNNLITLTKDTLQKARKIPIFEKHLITAVDFPNKRLHIRNLLTNVEFDKEYDFLVLATGGRSKKIAPISIDHPRVKSVHTLEDGKKIRDLFETTKIESVVCIGMGYIGLEMLETYIKYGIKDITIIGETSLFESRSMDYILKELKAKNINFNYPALVERVEVISDTRLRVVLKDHSMETDFIQINVGVAPNTEFLKGSGISMLPNGAIIVDEHMQTNIPNVFAAGDCATVFHRLLKKNVYMPLAPAANKQGRIAGNYIATQDSRKFPGVVGTIVCKVLDLYCAKTGLSDKQVQELNLNVSTTLIEHPDKASYYPGAGKMSVTLIYDVDSHLLLGAEIAAPSAAGAKRIDVLATALYAHMKVEDLLDLDLAYSPPVSPVYDPILIAANEAIKNLK